MNKELLVVPDWNSNKVKCITLINEFINGISHGGYSMNIGGKLIFVNVPPVARFCSQRNIRQHLTFLFKDYICHLNYKNREEGNDLPSILAEIMNKHPKLPWKKFVNKETKKIVPQIMPDNYDDWYFIVEYVSIREEIIAAAKTVLPLPVGATITPL
jgi:hypothetical protein